MFAFENTHKMLNHSNFVFQLMMGLGNMITQPGHEQRIHLLSRASNPPAPLRQGGNNRSKTYIYMDRLASVSLTHCKS